LGSVGDIFASHGVNVSQLIQKEISETEAELVVVTGVVNEGALNQALGALNALENIQSIPAKMRLGLGGEQS
jgi:hypothetical protein